MTILLFNFKSFITTKQQALEITQTLAPLPKNITCIVALPYSLIAFARDKVRGNPSIHIASQDISPFGSGAYTGLENAQLIADLGARYTLIGHPETYNAFALLNEDIQAKIAQANQASLTPIVYLNSSFEEADESRTIDISIDAINANNMDSLIVVYEVTDDSASPQHLKSVYKQVRKKISARHFYFVCGGVTGNTIPSLKQLKFIDGFALGYNALTNEERKKIYEQFGN